MPIYEYKCDSCGLVFEAHQKFSDAPLENCRECGRPVHKLISRSGFTLKGGGWYDQGYSSAPSCSAENGGACASCPKTANG